jgi:hypothetical protein
MKVESGVRKFEGAIFSKWYAWAQTDRRAEEGPLRTFKWRAKLDVRKLERKVRG